MNKRASRKKAPLKTGEKLLASMGKRRIKVGALYLV